MVGGRLALLCALPVWFYGCSQEGLDPAASRVRAQGAATAAHPQRAPEGAAQWNGAEISWYTFEEGRREAARSGRPILAVFKAGWCRQCKAYRRLFQDPQVVTWSKRFVMVLADDRADADASRRYAPDGGYVPRTLFLQPDGTLARSLRADHPRYAYFVDNRDPQELLALMKRAARQLGG